LSDHGVSDTSGAVPRSLGMLVVATLWAAFTLLLAMRLPRALKSFRNMFESFGTDIPTVTNFVIDTGPLWWLFAIASFAVFVWAAARAQPGVVEYRRMKVALCTVIAVTVLAYGFAALALYTPIFKMGAVVLRCRCRVGKVGNRSDSPLSPPGTDQ
jgi:hypothetical protein